MNRIVASAFRTTLFGLVSVAVVLIALFLQTASAQQKDSDGVSAGSNSSSGGSSTSRPVNFNIIQLLNGEYLEMFGTGTGHGILRGHPTISGIELGSLSADPLLFSTNSIERMRIMANGFVGIGTNNPTVPLELVYGDPNPYSPTSASPARIRFVNGNTTNNNVFEINLSSFDTSGGLSTGVRLAGIFTNHTPGGASADFAIGLRNAGAFSEIARFASTGNVGIGTSTPAYKLDVAGTIRSSSGGFMFPDGTVQTTASAGSGPGSQWTTSGANIYYNAGNVGLGTITPGVALDVSQGRAIRVGDAVLSSGGNNYVHLGNHAWFGGGWQFDGQPGALYQIFGQQHVWWTHNGAGGFISLMTLTPSGNLGIGTQSPSSRLHVDGGSIRLAQTQGQTPFQIYSHANSDSLWLTSGNATKSEIHLSPGYAVDYDRSIALQYVPGTTGGVAGILNVGQMSKNNVAWTHGATAFYTNGTERLRINSAGNVGIGTPAPAYRLDVQGGFVNASGGLCMNGDCRTTWSQPGSQWTTSGANISYNSGNVGIGIGSPFAKLHVVGVGGDSSATAIFSGSSLSSYFNYNGDASEDTYIRGGKTTSRVIINDAPSGNVLVATGGGNVGIGTASPTVKLHVAGDGRFTGSLTVDGNLAAKYQDLAEWVPASEQLSPGTVVVLDETTPNQVTSSSMSYDTRVAGVVSEQPGIALGEKSDNKVLVATTGRVRVKVDASKSPIRIGDLLVTSDIPGMAMKSEPILIDGRKMHGPGTLVGKALEPLEKGSGMILVLLSLQ